MLHPAAECESTISQEPLLSVISDITLLCHSEHGPSTGVHAPRYACMPLRRVGRCTIIMINTRLVYELSGRECVVPRTDRTRQGSDHVSHYTVTRY